MTTFNALSREYATLWDSMEIVRLQSSIDRTAQRIIEHRPRYEAIEQLTRVPWYVVGIIHAMESGLRFDRHLHNGDPLTRKTRLVPRGRPVGMGDGPFTFEQSATDALRMKGYHQIEDWPLERIAWALERYNGWGYRRYHPTTLSPYLWSGSNHYTAGKYVADGKWSSTAVSSQSGAMPLLKTICANCTDINLTSIYDATNEPEETTPASFPKSQSDPPKPATIGTGIAISGATIASAVGPTEQGLKLLEKTKGIVGTDFLPLIVPLTILGFGIIASILIMRGRND